MCGRFTIISDPVAYQMEFDIQMDGDIKKNWKPRYNVAPSQPIPVVKREPIHTVNMMQWGLVPNWSGSQAAKFNLINVRAETINEKIYFKRLVQQGKRCLILASGFYEWQKPESKGTPKTPYYFSLRDDKPFAFAGIWESARGADEQPATCAIITCAPNALVQPVHERMPVMLDAATSRDWLGESPLDQLLALLAPFPAERMAARPVSLLVNSPQAEGPQCILPAA